MPIARIRPIRHRLDATITVPGSKSLTNRALICGALARGTSVILRASDSEDTALMVNGLNQLGVLVRRERDELIVEGRGGRLYAPKFPIPVGNAGTTFRFLLSVAALAKGTTRFDIAPRMAERPISDLVGALGNAGVSVSMIPGSTTVEVIGTQPEAGIWRVRADKSSQFLSSLLLAAPYARGPVEVAVEGGLSSAPYVLMTLHVMEAFGVKAMELHPGTYDVPAPAAYQATTYAVEADASGASYPMVAAAILGGSVRIPGVGHDSLQGDAGFVEVLRRAGCTIRHEAGGVEVTGEGNPSGVEEDMNAMPDLVPSLAVMALFATGPTHIRNVAHLRYKESNRLETLAEELGKLGAKITVLSDGLAIHPAPLHGATLNPHQDHRLAMSFALAGLRIPDVVVEQTECVAKSFPRFWEELAVLVGGSPFVEGEA